MQRERQKMDLKYTLQSLNHSHPYMFMMVGLAGSGKSTYANKLSEQFDAAIFSSDALREEMFGDVNNQENNQKLFQELHKQIKSCLRSGHNAIYDATNISSKRRRGFLQELNNIDCYKVCIVMATPYENCLVNNRYRKKNVPKYVIERMYRNWNTPMPFEGWDNFYIKWWDETYEMNDIGDFLLNHIDYNQENPHHELMLGGHLISTASHYSSTQHYNNIDPDVYYACLLHDCGKPFTKTFKNYKGDKGDIAHYYNHENVGAYDALFFKYPQKVSIFFKYPQKVSILRVSNLINLHMQPYFWERDNNEKLHNKYKKLWRGELYNQVMQLHEADKAAH